MMVDNRRPWPVTIIWAEAWTKGLMTMVNGFKQNRDFLVFHGLRSKSGKKSQTGQPWSTGHHGQRGQIRNLKPETRS
jgi:hypothetical protein